jgi:hypothetical protein
MTVIQKLSDRESLIMEVVPVILLNMGHMDVNKLQWELLNRGIYIRKPLLRQAVSAMLEKGVLSKPEKDEVVQEVTKA